MVRRFVTAVGAALVLLMTSLSLPADAAAGGLVTGRVIDGAGNPVAGASISFLGLQGGTTANDGSYSVQVPAGTYYVSIFATIPDGAGKYSVNAAAQVIVNGDMTRNFAVPALVPVNLSLLNNDGTPAASTNLQVPVSTSWQVQPDNTLVRWMGMPLRYVSSPPIATDGSGRVTFSALDGSSTTVRAARANTFPVPLSVEVAANPTNATLTLPAMSRLTGRLRSAGGYAVPGAYVELKAGVAFVNAETARDGSYWFDAPDGTYGFTASFGGFPTAAFDSTTLEGEVTVLDSTSFDVTVPDPALLEVRLVHSDGSPATEGSVTSTTSTATLTSSSGTPLDFSSRYRASTQPDASGVVSTRALAGSQVTVAVDVPGMGTITGLVEMSNDPAETTKATITVATPSATVSGVVRDDAGQPLAGARVDVRSVDTSTGASVTTDSGGSWSAKVVPGRVRLTVQHSGSLPSGSYGVSATGVFDVATAASQDIELPIPTAFSPRLLDASDQPVPGVHAEMVTTALTRTMGGVDFDIRGGSLPSEPSDSSGQLHMMALPGSIVSGGLRQPDGFIFPFSVEVPAQGTSPVIRMGWFGSVPSQGANAGRVGIAGPPNTTLSELTSHPASSTPDGETALVGNVGYTLSGVVPGSTNDITLTLPDGSRPTKVLKVADDGTTTDATDHATISGNTIVLHLTDGGFGDADGVPNGVIVDPIVPVRASGATTTPTTVAVTGPTVAGTARVGDTLTAGPGTWDTDGVIPTYQWLADGIAISGATRATYVPAAEVLGKRIAVRVTGTKAGHVPGVSTSAPTAAVEQGSIDPGAKPYLTGVRRSGHRLFAHAGEWTPTGVTVRYVWLRDGRAFTAATTRSSYRLRSRDRGHRISVRVIVSKAGYQTRTARTAAKKIR